MRIYWAGTGTGRNRAAFFRCQSRTDWTRRNPMKKYLVAVVLIAAFVTPALAADYYVALRVGGGGCEVMTTEPADAKKYKMMGKYSSEADAKAAMAKMTECNK